MEYKMNVNVSFERPLTADLTDNDKLTGFIQYLEANGLVTPGSVQIDAATGVVRLKAAESLLQFVEKYLK